MGTRTDMDLTPRDPAARMGDNNKAVAGVYFSLPRSWELADCLNNPLLSPFIITFSSAVFTLPSVKAVLR